MSYPHLKMGNLRIFVSNWCNVSNAYNRYVVAGSSLYVTSTILFIAKDKAAKMLL